VDRSRPDGRSTRAWPETGAPTRNKDVFRRWTIDRRSGKLLHRRGDCERRRRAGPDRSVSTHPAERDAAQDVFHLASAEFGIQRGDGRNTAQCAVRVIEPMDGAFMAAERLLRQGDDAGQPVQAIRFKVEPGDRRYGAAASSGEISRGKLPALLGSVLKLS